MNVITAIDCEFCSVYDYVFTTTVFYACENFDLISLLEPLISRTPF
ncbi:hypothetical protein EG68_01901 [Paragonimus skrjabini miyazakii]|uniref:Uncharacterized protein n=1 Tax=Paragonimus skrjabini miyazakii TaxID=59628 RepID=A0A8S9YZT1_9TREM|nr:hypothetical protein EG68_01901 [Paragonimus skrjabini miyazakii]